MLKTIVRRTAHPTVNAGKLWKVAAQIAHSLQQVQILASGIQCIALASFVQLLTESLFCSDISDCWLVAIPIHDFYSQLGLAAQCAGSSSPSGRKLLGLAGADTALKALFTERKLSEHKLDVAALKTLSKARNLQSGAISASGTTG